MGRWLENKSWTEDTYRELRDNWEQVTQGWEPSFLLQFYQVTVLNFMTEDVRASKLSVVTPATSRVAAEDKAGGQSRPQKFCLSSVDFCSCFLTFPSPSSVTGMPQFPR